MLLIETHVVILSVQGTLHIRKGSLYYLYLANATVNGTNFALYKY